MTTQATTTTDDATNGPWYDDASNTFTIKQDRAAGTFDVYLDDEYDACFDSHEEAMQAIMDAIAANNEAYEEEEAETRKQELVDAITNRLDGCTMDVLVAIAKLIK
jgi:hypothetical protein